MVYLVSYCSKNFNVFLVGLVYFYHFNIFSVRLNPFNLIKYNPQWNSLLAYIKGKVHHGLYKFLADLYFMLFFSKVPQSLANIKPRAVTVNTILPDDFSLSHSGVTFSAYTYKFINNLMRSGKKAKAISLYTEFIYLHKLFNLTKNEIRLLGDVIASIAPKFKLINIKYRGRNRSVPKLVSKSKALNMGISLFLSGVRSRNEKSMVDKLKNELFDIYSLKGNSFKLKHANYKQGFSNRSLLFRRSANRRKRKLLKFHHDKLFIG